MVEGVVYPGVKPLKIKKGVPGIKNMGATPGVKKPRLNDNGNKPMPHRHTCKS